jgi:hypothetical protein
VGGGLVAERAVAPDRARAGLALDVSAKLAGGGLLVSWRASTGAFAAALNVVSSSGAGAAVPRRKGG